MTTSLVSMPSFDEFIDQFKARRKELPKRSVSASAIALRIISIYSSEGINIAHYYLEFKKLNLKTL